MLGPIPYISRTSLWNAWKGIRQELRKASIRDIVDYLEYDINPEKWINRLWSQIAKGNYEPAKPTRFSLGKSNGFVRTMTLPSIPDLTLYRAVAEFIYSKAKRREAKHVYFSRSQASKASQAAAAEAEDELNRVSADYRFRSRRSFLNWLKFDQYRKYLILRKVHPFLVVTDITNFFDSVLHSHVEEALRGLAIPPRMTGLLFFLLERLSIQQDYAASPGMSLPVDEFDCSRILAHLVLLNHDRAMIRIVGEDNYVRWMDDQNMGVDSKAQGLELLGHVGKSLGRLHLTPHPKKSQVLSLSQARRHFHLDINRMLDAIEPPPKTKVKRTKLARDLWKIWQKARTHEGVGEFGKVLKRFYRLAGLAKS
jgi:hypothetical protein